jgi:hypothetical protein
MRALAEEHGEHGWRAHAFPLSVDGIEIVASLVLLHHRRAGSSPGVLPWVALTAGTFASLAANVAVGGSDLIGRAVAGWPALALLVAIKLLAGLVDTSDRGVSCGPDHAVDSPPVGDAATPGSSQRTPNRPPKPGRRRSPAKAGRARSGTSSPGLEEAARAAFVELSTSGERLTRDALARALRERGHAVSNARASELLAMLRAGPPPVNGVRRDAQLQRVGQGSLTEG